MLTIAWLTFLCFYKQCSREVASAAGVVSTPTTNPAGLQDWINQIEAGMREEVENFREEQHPQVFHSSFNVNVLPHSCSQMNLVSMKLACIRKTS